MTLPHPRTRFVGRSDELAELASACAAGAPVITLWGPPGIGKTRLAIELCRRGGLVRHGRPIRCACFCDLGHARSAADIEATVAQQLGADSVSPIAALTTLAARGYAVIVLDNFEQLVRHAASTVGVWAETLPELTFLVTSRERLRLGCELIHELRPLAADDAATELFLDRAASAAIKQLDRARVVELVARLEGIPLAIELAAARLDVLGLEGLIGRLGQVLDLLAYAPRDAGPNHGTLRQAIDGSFRLLAPVEQQVLAQSSVFRGTFSLAAAESVLSADEGSVLDVLQSLRDKSLVRTMQDDGRARFALHDAIRAFAADHLDTDTRTRHARFYLARARTEHADFANLVAAATFALDAGILTGETLAALSSIDPGLMSDAIVELLGRALGEANRAGTATPLRVAGHRARGRALQLRGLIAQAREELESARAASVGDDALLGTVWTDLGVLHHQLRELEPARIAYETALELHVKNADRAQQARCRGNLGALEHDLGRHEQALEHYRRALEAFRALGERRLEAIFLTNVAVLTQERGEHTQAQRLYMAALEQLAEVGDRRLEAITRTNLGLLHHELGELAEACACHERALALFADVIDCRSEGLCLGRLAMALAASGRSDEARACCERARSLLGRSEDRVALGILAVFEAIVAGSPDEARARAELLADVCDDVRTALRLNRSGNGALGVGPDAAWLRLPDGSRQDLARRRPLRRLIARLVEQHRDAPGEGLTLDALREAGWPGERVLREAAVNRVHVALTELRRRGLKRWLIRRGDRYFFDPSLRIEISDG